MEAAEAEAIALQIQRDLNEEADNLRRDRRMAISVYVFYGFCLVGFTACQIALLALYRDDWERSCDIGVKVWSLVWLTRMIVQLVCNTAVTAWRMRAGASVPCAMMILPRLVHAFGFTWWLLGVDQLYFEPHCGEPTLARTVSQVMFWVTGTVYLIPVIVYTLICVCLPCIIYFMVRFAVRPADRQPTPPSLVQQLEVKTYRDLIENLRRQYTLDTHEVDIQQERRPLPSLSLETVIDGVSNLLTPGASSGSPGALSAGAGHGAVGSTTAVGVQRAQAGVGAGGPRGLEIGGDSGASASGLLSRQSISINRACPICMVDLDDEDEVLIMPCDNRHFFHKACVEHWLETSQACPICRANIVNILTGTPSDPALLPVDQRDLEMQI
ncbi:putative zinc finger (C3HC4 RING finger) protein [Neospora caninum Liverpool]|uniref:Putative zinc finger (C3HC4 RING finger) protein n=1 Tax=Neospora caninum (strain Liverpool) TaxID=572307 RepID=F0VFR6_NEOCL|nr:putative zinc finger (C3HC4 RING finger) protein [Neospora caninum Liverpool]CBZ52560.1 putative zinc finger (C3HC4 RING finger) protein [Neospora caninum Liverpool]CEL66535.1 TPA: zinc finger (C3HC4 RING finger) protein,putative [Neospora caninum Liverpool]|eukprot:XP_003882592.1 putative zinc finger (C3HC4 RING finger) protein [Neospora caninum Liverpool]